MCHKRFGGVQGSLSGEVFVSSQVLALRARQAQTGGYASSEIPKLPGTCPLRFAPGQLRISMNLQQV